MEILYPMFGMIVLSGIILVIFASTRVPGIYKMWGKLQFAKHSADLHPKLPEKARYLTDNYMVRYDIFDRPMMYTEGGLGILGKPLGLFKTFQQNFYAQFVEHVRDASKYGQVNGLATFVASNVIFAV